MIQIKTEININANAKKVWDILIDFEKWGTWNPIISKAKGVAIEDTSLEITMKTKEGNDANSYSPIITKVDDLKSLHFKAKMMAYFIFTNEKIFEIEETSDGIKLIHIENFSGLMIPLFKNKLKDYVPSMLGSMNEALKIEAEKKLIYFFTFYVNLIRFYCMQNNIHS